MANTYPITEAQKAILSRFTCQRLTACRSNLDDIQYFSSHRGEGLVSSLQRQGWRADLRGSTAYYVIKNPDGEIVMFFSLKCGVLFDPDYVEEYMEKFRESFTDDRLLKDWQHYLEGDEAAGRYFYRLYRQLGDEGFSDFLESLRIKSDKKHEPNKKIIRVSEARSAIELVEFCANDDTKDCWEQYGMPPSRKLGETMFWWFIVPKMLEVGNLIGCEYAFLFAADETPDGFLVRYYEDAFHFRKMTNLGTIKPYYDMNCYFMGKRLRSVTNEIVEDTDVSEDQDIQGLDYYREEFFANFNISMDAPDIA